MNPKVTNRTKSGLDNSSLWTLLGAALLSACGGGGSGGGGASTRGCGPQTVYNGSVICDQPFGDALTFTRSNGELDTTPSDPTRNLDNYLESQLRAQPGINSADFDADYNITIISTNKGTASAGTTNITNAEVPNNVKDFTSSQSDKDAWLGFNMIEGGKTYGTYYLNTRTGQEYGEITEDIVSSLNGGETIDIETRISFTVRTFVLNGQNVLGELLTDPDYIRYLQNEGFSVSGSTITSNIFTIRFVGANDLPTSQDMTISISSGAAMYDGFNVNHFAFNDLDDGDLHLISILISSAPVNGNLTLEQGGDEEAIAIAQGDRVERADIANLVYTPSNTFIEDTFGFRVSDGEADSSASYTLTLDVA